MPLAPSYRHKSWSSSIQNISSSCIPASNANRLSFWTRRHRHALCTAQETSVISENTVLTPQEEVDLDGTIQRIAEHHGYVSNLMQTLALAPPGLAAFAELGTYVRYGSHLTELQRILAIIVAVRDVHYGWMHNAPLAEALGVTQEQLQLLREGRIPKDLGSTERALCDYVFEITAGRHVPIRVAEEIHAHFVPRQIVDIALLTVHYMAVASLATGLDVPLEPPETLQFELQWHQQKAS